MSIKDKIRGIYAKNFLTVMKKLLFKLFPIPKYFPKVIYLLRTAQ